MLTLIRWLDILACMAGYCWIFWATESDSHFEVVPVSCKRLRRVSSVTLFQLIPDMDSVSGILLLVLTCTVIQVLRSLHARSRKPNHKLPPGPSPFEIVGNIFELGKKPQETLAKLAKIHGPVMSLKLGQLTTIVFSSPHTAKEVLQTHDQFLSDRTVPQVATAHNHHPYSLPFLHVSPLWRELRKICNIHLFSVKNLDASEDLRRIKLQELLRDIHRSSLTCEAVDVRSAAFKACINFLSYTFFSQDFVQSLDGKEEYKDIVVNLIRAIAIPNLTDFFPVLKMVDPQGIKRCSATNIRKLFHIFDHLIDERLKLREAKDYVTNNDMLDSLLNLSEGNSQQMGKEQIKHFFLDLFVAGTDTTAYALERTLSELLHNPEVMSKVKKELEQTIGIGNPIKESDVARLPYLQAVIKESLRLYPPAPLLVPRRARKDVEICGYTIPQGAQVLINEWAICRNPSIWDNAELFSPERFLGSEIDVKGHHFNLTPFGSGRRVCPGSPLAMRMLHLMLGSLINSFDWKLENNMKPEDMDLDQNLRAIPIKINNL